MSESTIVTVYGSDWEHSQHTIAFLNAQWLILIPDMPINSAYELALLFAKKECLRIFASEKYVPNHTSTTRNFT